MVVDKDKILNNYKILANTVKEKIPQRAESLLRMYDLFSDRILLSPSNSSISYPFCYPGGFLESILKLADVSVKMLKFFKHLSAESTQNISEESVLFVALNQDLGKLGLPNSLDFFIPNNESDWEYKKGFIYSINKEIPISSKSDRTLYILNYFKVPMSFEESLAIKLSDLLLEENRMFYTSRESNKLNLPYIISLSKIILDRTEKQRIF